MQPSGGEVRGREVFTVCESQQEQGPQGPNRYGVITVWPDSVLFPYMHNLFSPHIGSVWQRHPYEPTFTDENTEAPIRQLAQSK